jgi:(2Fe-2S) ferredoxin
MKYDKHIFICKNDRGENSTRQSCGRCGGLDIRKEFVSLINAAGLKGKIRANKSGCLDLCEQGPAIVIYPQGLWYLNVEKRNIEIFFMNLLLVVIKLLSLSQTRNN